MTDDANSILMGSGAPHVKFETVGTQITGTVTQEPRSSQQTTYRTRVPEFWKDGSPKMQVIVRLATNLRDPQKPDDDGTRDLYIKGKQLTEAIRNAVRQSGANGIHTGGQLTVAYIGDGPADPGLDDGPKLYAAQYQPPAVSFNGVTAPAAAGAQQMMAAPMQQQMPAPVQQAYIPPAAPQQAIPGPLGLTTPQPVQQVAPQQLQCPPNVDPGMWGRLSLDQQRAVIAANTAQAQPGF